MNKLTTIVISLFIVVSAYASEPVIKETAKPIELTKATFLEKVFDYEKILIHGNTMVINLPLLTSMLHGVVLAELHLQYLRIWLQSMEGRSIFIRLM